MFNMLNTVMGFYQFVLGMVRFDHYKGMVEMIYQIVSTEICFNVTKNVFQRILGNYSNVFSLVKEVVSDENFKKLVIETIDDVEQLIIIIVSDNKVIDIVNRMIDRFNNFGKNTSIEKFEEIIEDLNSMPDISEAEALDETVKRIYEGYKKDNPIYFRKLEFLGETLKKQLNIVEDDMGFDEDTKEFGEIIERLERFIETFKTITSKEENENEGGNE